MSGISLTTKGMVAGGADTSVPDTALPFPPAGPAWLEAAPTTGTAVIVVPTAINTTLMAVENITANLQKRQPASLTMPSMYKRAYLVAYETDEIAVVTQ